MYKDMYSTIVMRSSDVYYILPNLDFVQYG